MKKILLFSVIALLMGCSKSNDPGGLTKSQITGKWNETQALETFINADGITTSQRWTDMTILGWYSQFNSDGTYVSHESHTFYGTWSLSGQSVLCNVNGVTVTYAITSLIGNNAIITISYSDGSSGSTIKATKE